MTGQEQTTAGDRLPVGPVPRDLPPVTGPQHYQVQFSTVEEHAQLVERAKALLARTRPGVTLGELHLEAMRLLVASLEKRKFAVPDRIRRTSAKPSVKIDVGGDDDKATEPRQRGDDGGSETTPGKSHDGKRGKEHDTCAAPRPRGVDNGSGSLSRRLSGSDTTASESHDGKRGHNRNATATPRHRGDDNEPGATPHWRGDDGKDHGGKHGYDRNVTATPPQRGALRDTVSRSRDRDGDATPRHCDGRDVGLQRSRYVPAPQRREVYRRDGGQCTDVDAQGERCCETRYLELHHLQPFAKNGASTATNLTLRCSAHNALAAEEDFGLPLVVERRSSMRHEALARQQPIAD